MNILVGYKKLTLNKGYGIYTIYFRFFRKITLTIYSMYLTSSLDKANANDNPLKKDLRVYIRYQKFDYKSERRSRINLTANITFICLAIIIQFS